MRSDHEGSAVRLELFVNKLMPFDLHATGSAVWNHYVYAKDRLPNRMYNHSIRHVRVIFSLYTWRRHWSDMHALAI
jgi:hypothetical protein